MTHNIRAQYLRLLDLADNRLCNLGVTPTANWNSVLNQSRPQLYAGKLSRSLPQWTTSYGLTPYFPNSRNILHDLNLPHQLPEGSLFSYQAEDVFEHLTIESIPAIIEDIYRILVPGGTFRLSVPDYRFSVYRERSLCDENGNIVFDPGGGGGFVAGRVTDGGHLWFPLFEHVEELFGDSSFGRKGSIDFLHYNRPQGGAVIKPIDYRRGNVQRTPDHDARALSGEAISIVVDAVKAR